MKSDYEQIKQQCVSENNFLAEGVFYVENSTNKLTAFVAKDGLLVPENKQLADGVLRNPSCKEILFFENNGRKYFGSIDHNINDFRINMPGVVYPPEFRKTYVELTNKVPHLKKIDINASDEEFVEYVNYLYFQMLHRLNHPSKNIEI